MSGGEVKNGSVWTKKLGGKVYVAVVTSTETLGDGIKIVRFSLTILHTSNNEGQTLGFSGGNQSLTVEEFVESYEHKLALEEL